MPFYARNTPNLLSIAKRAAERSIDYQPYAIIAIVFSAIAIEGFVNDLLADVSWVPLDELDPPLRQLQELAAAAGIEDRHTPLFRKISVIYVALTGKRCDTGRQPFQDLDLLLDLRNSLVHSRPETLNVEKANSPSGVSTHHQVQPAKLAVRLAQRGIVPSPPKEVLTSLLAILHHPNAAAWAYNTAIASIRDLTSLHPGWEAIFVVEEPLNVLPLVPA